MSRTGKFSLSDFLVPLYSLDNPDTHTAEEKTQSTRQTEVNQHIAPSTHQDVKKSTSSRITSASNLENSSTLTLQEDI